MISSHVCCSICGIWVLLVSMKTRGQDSFITTSVIVVAVKLTGHDTNEKWCKNEGSENRVPAIGNSVSMSIKLY